MMMEQPLIRQLCWSIFAISLLVFTLGLSWQLNKSTNFLYSTWYQALAINDTIVSYAPKNTYGKSDFPADDAELHEQMFSDIVQSIHQHGVGLSQISYVNQQGTPGKLLTKNEVEHLQDVANLLDVMTRFWWWNLALLATLFVLYFYRFSQGKKGGMFNMPTGKQKLSSVLCVFVMVLVTLSIWGFTRVFYYLHTLVFPSEHQWFFYYQESLMSTLMKAPDIFSVIAGQLLFIALLLAWGLDLVMSHLLLNGDIQNN